jgi:adenosine kinase
MHFAGKFSESLLPDQLEKISVSFLVDDLQVRRGGVGANIAYGMGQLGESPVLIAAVGSDFDEYRNFLTSNGVNCDWVRVSGEQHTARFVCTTDDELCQIASFYPGAMSEAAQVELAPAWAATGADLVLIGADDPAAMVRHTEECRERGLRFAADPSQQIAFMDGASLAALLDGAALLFTNEYEKGLLESKTGLSEADIMAKVGIRVTTLGSNGVEIVGKDLERVYVPVAKVRTIADPTGVGDGFRAGFLSARSWGLSWERAAQVGCLLAAHVLESVGPQEYSIDKSEFASRLAESYGDECAAEVLPHLR